MYSLNPPFLIKYLERFNCKFFFLSKRDKYTYSVLILTYITYCLYHLSRRPFSVVRSVLAPNCSSLIPPAGLVINDTNQDTWCAWEPFNVKNPNFLFGILDSFYLFSYAFFMFFSGFIAERVHLRYFLSFGMLFCGIFTYLFGLAYYYNIHNIYYFLFIQIVNGAFQTTGWPAVVTTVGNWCPKSSRNLIYGIWNSHTNLGNMLGALIGGSFLEYNWGLSFIVPGFAIGFFGFIIFFVLVPYPQEVGLEPVTSTKPKNYYQEEQSNFENSNNKSISSSNSNSPNLVMRRNDDDLTTTEGKPLIINISNSKSTEEAISFYEALMMPEVIYFSFSLFFCKLVNYIFLYWLPTFIKQTTSYNSKRSALLSMAIDVGGIFGSILIAFMADYSGSSAICCLIMFILTIPIAILFDVFENVSLAANIFFQLILGCLLNGPYALITTSVAANLSNKVNNSKSLATISAIIDGVGSIGAAIGPLLAGFFSSYSWNSVIFLTVISTILAGLSLSKIVLEEYKKLYKTNE